MKGQFKEFEGTLEVGPEGAVAYGTVKTASVDTREPQRDAHLRSADFFEAETYPEISFRSTAIRPTGEEEFEIEADLSIHGRSRARSRCRRRWRASSRRTTRARRGSASPRRARSTAPDFEMRFNAALGSGNVVVSDKVKILVEISAVKQA